MDYRSRNYRFLDSSSSREYLTLCKKEIEGMEENLKTKSELYQVIPVQDHGSVLQIFSYKRILVECLSTETIRRMYEMSNAKAVSVLETPSFFLVQYPGKPIIFINRRDGRLYALSNDGYKEEEREFQASFVIRIFHKFNLVEDLHSKKRRKRDLDRKEMSEEHPEKSSDGRRDKDSNYLPVCN